MKVVKSNSFEVRGHMVVRQVGSTTDIVEGGPLITLAEPIRRKLQNKSIISLTPHIFCGYIEKDYVESYIIHVHYRTKGGDTMLVQFDQYIQFKRVGDQWTPVTKDGQPTLVDQLNEYLEENNLELVRPFYGEGNCVTPDDEFMMSHHVLFAEVREKPEVTAPTAEGLNSIKDEGEVGTDD